MSAMNGTGGAKGKLDSRYWMRKAPGRRELVNKLEQKLMRFSYHKISLLNSILYSKTVLQITSGEVKTNILVYKYNCLANINLILKGSM